MKNTPISRIYHQANGDAPQGGEARRRNLKARRELWHRLGVAVIDPEDIHDDWERQQVTNQANKLYGQRRGT
ncbi:hypothetical protein NBRC116590_02900 [Pelagimonas sp. KU-00592-HH]